MQEKSNLALATFSSSVAVSAVEKPSGCPGLRIDVAWRDRGLIESTGKVYRGYSMKPEMEIGIGIFLVSMSN